MKSSSWTTAPPTEPWSGWRVQPHLLTIRNAENLGFPKGCNQGLPIARGENLLLLNNDTIVTPRWLEQLTSALQSDASVGAVGPVTNNASVLFLHTCILCQSR